MPTIARLSRDGIYLGVREVDSVSDGDVPVPPNCDLAAGKYLWNGETNTFEPLVFSPRQTLDVPNVLRVVALLVRSRRDNVPVPQEALDFLRWYEQRFEGR